MTRTGRSAGRCLPVFWVTLVLAHGFLSLSPSSAQPAPQDPLCSGEGTSVKILSPPPGTTLAMELHGMGRVAVHLEVLICNFESQSGSLGVFTNDGESKLQEVWNVRSGRRNVTVLNDLPGSKASPSMIEALEKGFGVDCNIEVSLLDAGYEIGASASVLLRLISRHIPRADAAVHLNARTHKPVIYLMNTEKESVVPDLVSESSDFVQLVWGPVEPTMPGRIWAPGCTVNEGWNHLYWHVRNGDRHYTYLVFVDDDATLILAAGGGEEDQEVLDNPWREFERLLLEWRPAVGYARYSIQQPQERKEFASFEAVQCIRFADQLLAAYHFEAASFILPFTTHFDQESWWYSSMVVNLLSHIHFSGHVMQFNTLQVHDDRKVTRYDTGLRQMNWQRVIRWMSTSLGSEQQLESLGVLDPSKIMCDPAILLKKRERPFVVDRSDFDLCHPLFSDIRGQIGTMEHNCSVWNHEEKLVGILLIRSEQDRLKREHLQATLDAERGKVRDLEKRMGVHEERVALLLQHAGISCHAAHGGCWEEETT
ncbi:hypothetical protein T484DRAFT_1882066 [Baffinella frigidus]|nr:hypothetical protein T484DRAFT_1882066 [Cryptophyta sp. CCMP2293]